MSTRLQTIASRQHTGRLRTAVFAVCLALAGVVSVASMQTAVAAAHVDR